MERQANSLLIFTHEEKLKAEPKNRSPLSHQQNIMSNITGCIKGGCAALSIVGGKG